MGIRLVEEVMDHAPDTLTAMEWKGLVVLARDANDNTRVTYHGVNEPEILHRVGVSKSRWDNIRGALLKTGVIEYARRADGSEIRGNRGGSAKFRIVHLPGLPNARKPAASQQPSQMDAGNEQSSEESVPEPSTQRGGKDAGIRDERMPEPGTPTPLSSSTSLLPPGSDADGQQVVEDGREGGVAPEEKRPEFLALAAALAGQSRIALGEREMVKLLDHVTPWLERSTAQHLRTALTQGLPHEVGNPLGLVRKRLLTKLPPQAPERPAPGVRCSGCFRERPAAVHHEGKAYCAHCTDSCSKCHERVPESLLLDELCGECRKE